MYGQTDRQMDGRTDELIRVGLGNVKKSLWCGTDAAHAFLGNSIFSLGSRVCTPILNPAVLVLAPHKLCSHIAKSYEPRSSHKTWHSGHSFRMRTLRVVHGHSSVHFTSFHSCLCHLLCKNYFELLMVWRMQTRAPVCALWQFMWKMNETHDMFDCSKLVNFLI